MRIFLFFTILLLFTTISYSQNKPLENNISSIEEPSPTDYVSQFKYGCALIKRSENEDELLTAIQWIKQSASFGYGPALSKMGTLHKKGKGVEYDLALAYSYFDQAVNKYPRARYSRGYMHYKGLGTAQNYNLAYEDFSICANQGIRTCMYMLGLCYKNGFGIDKDLETANCWLNKSADKGFVPATRELLSVSAEVDDNLEELIKQSENIEIFKKTDKYIVNEFNKVNEIYHVLSASQFSGYWVKYDYSGKNITSFQNIQLQCDESDETLSCELLFTQSGTKVKLEADTYDESSMTLSSVKIKRNDRYIKRKSDMLKIEKIAFNFLYDAVKDESMIMGNINGFSTHEKEPEKPIKIFLRPDIVQDDSNPIAQQNNATPLNTTLTAFPNPFIDLCYLNLDLESPSVFDLMIHDVNGKLVYTKNNNKLSKGIYIYPIDLSQTVAGTYFVSLKSNKSIKTIKIVKE